MRNNTLDRRNIKVRKMRPQRADGTRTYAAKQQTKQRKRIRKAMA